MCHQATSSPTATMLHPPRLAGASTPPRCCCATSSLTTQGFIDARYM
ncbi:hypothetical protein PVAP13_6KG214606 [Panicum virgatum]|uniref:Uncharacterized protein n=1 Tax=Panicum virgatum TaxID=38727 RepID=A0A8T0RF06_PANVG|nr:hypothetical protein PVAP13_6KG214606 [Panicum virgatum]